MEACRFWVWWAKKAFSICCCDKNCAGVSCPLSSFLVSNMQLLMLAVFELHPHKINDSNWQELNSLFPQMGWCHAIEIKNLLISQSCLNPYGFGLVLWQDLSSWRIDTGGYFKCDFFFFLSCGTMRNYCKHSHFILNAYISHGNLSTS